MQSICWPEGKTKKYFSIKKKKPFKNIHPKAEKKIYGLCGCKVGDRFVIDFYL